MSKTGTVVLALLALGLGIGIGKNLPGQTPTAGTVGGPVLVSSQQSAVMEGTLEEKMVTIAEQVSPAVVSISPGRGVGSGFFIRKDGVILTNAHVVQGAREVMVKLADGRRLRGRVLGGEPSIDTAVVRVEGSDFPAIPLADSDGLKPGQTAVAIGSPLGLERTITTGVVSAVNRRLDDSELEGLIQTDASINPGNSGGPLLDSQGRVIGINTAILTAPGGGLGFAIPINLAANAANQVLTTGRVRRVFLGVDVADVNPVLAEQFNLPVREGAVVLGILRNSPADRAGLQIEDIITRIDGAAITGGGDIRRVLRSRQPGDTVAVTVQRENRSLTLNATLAEATSR